MGKTKQAFLLFIAILSLSASHAQVILDPEFGINGRAIVNAGSGADIISRIKIQTDGKIVVAGHVGTIYSYWTLARYNSDGTIDTAFGQNGVVITPYGGQLISLIGLTIQPDGKILLTAAHQPDPQAVNYVYTLQRFNTDGSIDNTFGTNGVALNDFSFGNNANGPTDIAVQSDQKIIVIGSVITQSNGRDIAVIRYNSDGTLDNNFGVNGLKTIDFLGSSSNNTNNGSRLVLQPDGKMLIASYSGFVPQYDLSVVRLNADGSFDTSFGNNGIVIYDLGASDSNTHLALTADNKIVAGGMSYFNNEENSNIFIIKLNSDGSRDMGFGTDGKITIQTEENPANYLAGFRLQPDGKIVVAGANGSDYLFMFRYTPEGIIDNTFDTDGQLFLNSGANERAHDIALLDDGKFLLAGGSSINFEMNTSMKFAVTRFMENNLSTENPQTEMFSIYPNPTDGMLNIRAEGIDEIQSVSIFNMLSQLVLTSNSTAHIDVSSLETGAYLMKINNGKKFETLKFLKK